jgi:hypothetical protein
VADLPTLIATKQSMRDKDRSDLQFLLRVQGQLQRSEPKTDRPKTGSPDLTVGTVNGTSCLCGRWG